STLLPYQPITPLFPYTTLFRSYYKQYRERVKFILMECEKSFENCFCVSMKTNKTDNYSMFIKREDDNVLIKVKDDEFSSYFDGRSEEHTSELQSRFDIVCRLLL